MERSGPEAVRGRRRGLHSRTEGTSSRRPDMGNPAALRCPIERPGIQKRNITALVLAPSGAAGRMSVDIGPNPRPVLIQNPVKVTGEH